MSTDHWTEQADGSYVSSHPKYAGMVIRQTGNVRWELLQHGSHLGQRGSLKDAKWLAKQEANWEAPSGRH